MGSAKFRKMIFPYVILLFLSWPYAKGTESKDFKDAKETKSVETPETLIDQIAVASENVVTKTEKEERIADETSKQSTHYENSNGFVPMASFSFSETSDNNNRQARFYEKPNDDKLDGLFEDDSKLENDPVFSTEARIMLNLPQSGTNRRSFEVPENQNDFELLKVKNDTPAIANYQDFYDNVESTVENTKGQRTSSREKSRDRGKRIESYVTNYGAENDHDNDDRDSSYSYYSYGMEKERKKSAHDPEKVQSNYHQQNSMNYNGHGSNSEIIRNAPATSSSRTNLEDNELGENKHADDNYDDDVATSVASKSRHRFLKPVVVAEPNDYKVEMKFNDQPSKPKLSSTSFKTSSKSDSTSAGSNNYNVYVKDAARSFDHADTSDYSMEYSDYTERPRRLHKSRRRPHYSETSRKLPKEHRGSFEDSADVEERRRPSHSRPKSHRHRTKEHSWIEDDREEESYEERPHDTRGEHSVRTESKNTKNQQGSKPRTSSSWSQLTPNIEISHSSGIEIEQPDKPKLLVPVKVNLVPIGNFDHDTALGNSQGFDVSNAVLHNFITAAPANTVSTVAPVLTTAQTTMSKGSKNIVHGFPQIQNVEVSTPVPDIIVGHNTFHNPLQSFFVQQTNIPKNNSRSQYSPSTVGSIFAITPTGNPVLQSFSIQNSPTTARPTSIYTAMPNVTPALLMNQVQATTPHFFFSQPNFGSLPNIVHTPGPTSQTNIQVNPHGLQGQNAISNANMQTQHLQIVPTVTSTMQSPTVTRLNIISGGFQNKKNTFSDGNGNFLASASLAVSQAAQKPNNGNNYYVQNQNNQQMYKPELQESRQYIQATPIIPTMLNAGTNLHNFNINSQQLVQNQQNIPNGNFLQQMQMQLQRNQLLNVNALPSFTYQTIDNTGSNSNNNINTLNGMRNSVGVKNVEIVNPNIKSSPVDTTNINSNGGISQYPASIFTTSMPIFATTNAFVTARQQPSTISPDIVSVQNYLDSLTEIGAKGTQSSVVTLKPSQHHKERPVFDPINFVPNLDVVKNQAILNSKQNTNTQTQQQQALNLVPLVPGGNFFKPSLTAQKDLLTKPKLTSDMEKYADEMFKESLRTIYNSHKWNNDHKVHGNIFNSSDIDLSQLKSELQRLKSAMPNAKTPKEILEAHQSENNIRTAELTKPSSFGNDQKKDALLSTLEQLLKAHPSEPIQVYSSSSNNKHTHSSLRPSLPDPGPTYQTDYRNHKHPHHFLIPPKHNHHSSKNHYHDKPGHRPGPHRHRHNDKSHFHGPRRHPKSRPSGPDASASNINGVHVHGAKFEHFHGRPSYDRENSADSDFGTHRHRSNYQQSASSYDTYPTFTTSTPDKDYFNKHSNEWKPSRNNDYLDINHPRIHNLLGLLMKNKQLPSGETQNLFRDKDELKKFFEDEKRRIQQQFYDDTLKNPHFQKRLDNAHRSKQMLTPNRNLYTPQTFA